MVNMYMSEGGLYAFLKLFTGKTGGLEAGGNISGLEALQGGHGNQSGWRLVPDVDGCGEEGFPQCLCSAVWL